MCDVACVKVQTKNTRYRKKHWKLSLRPVFSKYMYTEPYALSQQLTLRPVNPGYENSILQTPDSKTVAELKFENATGEVEVAGQVFSFNYERGARSWRISNGNLRCIARYVKPCSRVLELEWGIQKLRIVPVHAWRKEFVISVVEERGSPVDDMKVVEIVRTDLSEIYDVKFVDFAKIELVACVAWLIIVVNRS